MVTGKNRSNSFNNLYSKRRSSSNQQTFNDWIKKTFIRTVISVTLLIIVLIIQLLNFKSSNQTLELIKLKLEHKVSINTYIEEAKQIPGYIMTFGNKAVEAIKVEDKLKNKFILPTNAEITTYFDENIGDTLNVSKGLIFSTNSGDPIYSIDDGVVIDIGSNKSIGNYIIIKHKGELLSVYKYLSNNQAELNQRIEKGQIIGDSSEKLLLEVWYRNEPIDPMQYIDTSMEQL